MGFGRLKGAIAVGHDADLAFVDLGDTWRLDRSDIVSSANYSIYEGWQFRDAIVHAMSRGRFVMREKELQDDMARHGRFVKRSL